MSKFNVNPTGAGTFGFTAFAETWNGRLAMIGLVCALGGEVVKGKGLLGQMGIEGRPALLVLLLLAGVTVASMLGYYAVNVTRVSSLPVNPAPVDGSETDRSGQRPVVGAPSSQA